MAQTEHQTTYYLRRGSLDPQIAVEINRKRYLLLVEARNTLVDAGAFEQRYESLLGNFIAFEMFCAEHSLRGKLEFEYHYEHFARVLAEANRHAMNLLATSRQHADQVVRGFQHIRLEQQFDKLAKKHLGEAYASSKEYRLVYELRNHMQHRASVVHGMEGRIPKTSWAESTLFFCSKRYIVDDPGKFKQRVLDETDDVIDLQMIFRGYMAAASKVQRELRKYVQQACDDARNITKEAIDDFSVAQPGWNGVSNVALGLAAYIQDGEELSGKLPLLLDWDDARVALANKNNSLIC